MIRELDTLLGRHDEAELVAVFPAPFHERSTILNILAGRVDLAFFSVLGHTVALQIPQMGINGLGADKLSSSGSASLRIELHNSSLDRDPP
jgi:hypothetical protein